MNPFKKNFNSLLSKLNLQILLPFPEAATEGALWKKVFLEISQNSR